VARFKAETNRTTYLYDVRTSEEFIAGHLPGFRSAPGGQLVQETDMSAPVRGARVVLADVEGVRANMTASWLAQMDWDVWVLDNVKASDFSETGPHANALPEPEGPITWVSVAQLSDWVQGDAKAKTAILDFSTSAQYVKQHIPGAWFVLRSELAKAVARSPAAQRYVLTCETSQLARYAAIELARLTGAAVVVLEGGNRAWIDAGLPLEQGESRLASERIDRYRRPYEGTDNPREAMQGYLDWEFGLVEQLARDGTHGFNVM
jgi:rhodanese-related sulfurtransferase